MTWIVPERDRCPTPNCYYNGRHVKPIEFVVYHFTAGALPGCLNWLRSPNSSVSAHFVIGKDGHVYQLASLNTRTWHAGGRTSKWRGGRYVNDRSIGIEIENWGKLQSDPVTGDWCTWNWKPFYGQVFLASDATVWDQYTEEQIESVVRVTQKLVEQFPILASDDDRLVGHRDVDPNRKTDPGPAFPWERLRSAVKAYRGKTC